MKSEAVSKALVIGVIYLIHFSSSLFRNNNISTNILISAAISFLIAFFSTFLFTFSLALFAFLSNATVIYKHLPYFIPFLFLIAFILSFLVLTRQIVKDLIVINHSVQTIAKGDLGYRIPDMQISEFKNLSFNLNSMLNHIQNETMKQNQLEDSRIDLIKRASEELYLPLTHLINNVEHLTIHSAEDSQQYSTLLQIIYDDALQLKEIMDDLLELSRLSFTEDHLDFADTDLSLFLDEVILGLIPVAEKKGVRLKKEMILFPIHSQIDKTKMSAAITHLLKITMNYSNNNGFFRFTLNVLKSNIMIGIEYQTESRVGPVNQKIVYNNAQKTHQIQSHKALALSIARTIIEKHGGNLSLSHINNSVLITLPLDRKPTF
ncbi:HAMP domain-containing histidine kinase [Paenibacillus polysaccharolyticus]|uniref:HAMP domain-containing sensor histidine kinase n=1 Tax=Paenibacillus polysaccharolyticus TaxID=582692 RepID=UPI00209E8C29|nr:HAMP domain-containing sensor histidine kinase [Paenibacillus polysaccharolyticus]MCP1133701.1 HAMP domain-containing histidine kinase [Paenibacillus polysaccharolyticus]